MASTTSLWRFWCKCGCRRVTVVQFPNNPATEDFYEVLTNSEEYIDYRELLLHAIDAQYQYGKKKLKVF